jgi:hypothetical protein
MLINQVKGLAAKVIFPITYLRKTNRCAEMRDRCADLADNRADV